VRKSGPKRQEPRKSFTTDEMVLIWIREECYDGSWEEMLRTLDKRLKSVPKALGLRKKICAEIALIRKLQSYEKRHKLNLAYPA
jgi:hypothetical protein